LDKFSVRPRHGTYPGQSIHEYLAERKGVSPEKGKEMNDYMSRVAKEVGLEYNFDKALITNTLNAHRFLHLANWLCVQNLAKEKLLAAYYTKGMDIGSVDTLIEIGTTLNMPAEEIRSMLQSDLYID
jgi:predicted DsbA family dithiol-disulfide isomerase